MNIETSTQTTPFTPAQIELLKILAHPMNENDVQELHNLLQDFLQKKIDAELNSIWDERGMTEDTIDDILNNHIVRKK